ncbi:MAG: transposase [Fimbriimonadales bacterium]
MHSAPLHQLLFYPARSWARPRRVVAKIERSREGMNVRFLVTNRRRGAEEVFNWYEQRGQAENFPQELKNDLEAERLWCTQYRANAFRLKLHALAYNLFVLFRRLLLGGTELARATVGSIRLRLLKIGARGKQSAPRLWSPLASGWPGGALFLPVLDRLAALGPPG